MQSLRKTPRQCRATFLLQRPHGIVELRLFTSRATRPFLMDLPRMSSPKNGRFEIPNRGGLKVEKTDGTT